MLNDMWEFNPSTNQWTWVTGPSTAGTAGVYGVIGQGSGTPANNPSAREGAATWTDSATGRLWMFGGGGFDSTGVGTTSSGGGELNDLWSFNPATQQWAWMGGPSVAGGAGVFAVAQSSPGAPNFSILSTPGARMWGTGFWVQPSGSPNGTFWLFGGNGVDQELVNGSLNDLWTISLTVPAP
jgi:hypothetical protein